ncbi:DUF3426 domain-containing protein [Oceanobacter kriegii]|uniref:DUF3426 domain-containing protein n=1 Tax=Oceanobacter kriegii TaxID=64972 RepID=UPI0004892195|nr:DUF3426 domain-containing protein [Oceanobacter kriegii]
MATHVTRCPHCQTSFRVRDEHLSRAGGKVRCGSCLQVFNCTEHLVSADSLTRKTTAETSDDTSFDIAGQQEVDANQLFDSMFGAAADDEPDSKAGLSDELDPGEFIADEPVTREALRKKEQKQRGSAAASKPSIDDDDFLIHDDMDLEDDEIADDPYSDNNLRTPDQLKRPKPSSVIDLEDNLIDRVADDSSLSSTIVDGNAYSLDDIEDDQDEDDEAWAKALLDDDTPAHIERELGLGSASESSGSSSPSKSDGSAASNINASDINAGNTSSHTGQGKTAASSTLNARSRDTQTADAVTSDSLVDESKTLPLHARSSRIDSSRINFELAEDQPGDEKEPASSARHQALTGNLQPTPLALKTRQRADKNNTLFTLATVVLLVLFAGQVLFFNFQNWAKDPQWRPVYQVVCQVSGCVLPSVQDVNAMTTRNLVVRSHPELANALVVDVLLVNNKGFSQPFPDLSLQFTDLNENTVASRVFHPDEYLSGEAAGQQLMPSKTPIHVALEIIDPGQEAVSYAVNLLANQE